MSSLDLFLILLLIAMGSLIIIGAGRMPQSRYSQLLIGIIITSAILISLFQIYDIDVEGNSAAHSAIFSISQLAIYGLASNLWLRINYQKSTLLQKKLMHVCSHTIFITFIVSSYWLKSLYPLINVLIYPFCGFSISLIQAAIGKKLNNHRMNKNKV
jgi:hypothetical protein